MSAIDNFVKTYSDENYQHTTMVRHKGTVVALAMDNARHIYYSVLNLEGSDRGPLDVNYWLDNPVPLPFSNEIVQVGYSLIDPVQMPIVKKGTRQEAPAKSLRPEEIDSFLSSTARLTADAQFHALSDGKYIYIFRQSIEQSHEDMVFDNSVPLVNETLLVDRYVLTGTQLQLKREVRFRRSRNQTRPESDKDSLGAQDMEKKPFFEPTQELDFIHNLQGGRFTVLLLPTQIASIQRWQIFTHNSQTGLIDSFNVEQSKDGLFNTKGTQFYTSPDPQYQGTVFERQPGKDPEGNDLIPIISKQGFAESALEFDGQGDYIDCGDILTDSYSKEAWIKLASNPGANNIVSGQSKHAFYMPTGNLKAGHNGKWDYVADPNTSQVDVWIHVAVTYDSVNQDLHLYKDGTLVDSESGVPGFETSDRKVYIGRFGSGNYFKGRIDEVRLWNRPRSADEIKQDMHRRLVGNEPGLVGYWRFDEGSGTSVRDQTDNANHGTIYGDPTWVQSDAPIGDNPGIRRSSFEFAGRTVVSGLTALSYYRQENTVTGYDDSAKPVKTSARVMLAAATQGTGETEKYVAALDFAVSREGKLVQVPDRIDLGPALSEGRNEDLKQLEALEKELEFLRRIEQDGEHKIQAENQQARDYFGNSVALSGDWALVGAYSEDTEGSSAGAAYLFHLENGQWQQQQKILAEDAQAYDYFGNSVALSGDWALVGAYSEDTEGSSAGAAYLFHLENGQWQQQQKIQASDARAGDQFGISVALSGDWALVGASGERNLGAGAAYLFHLENGQWQEQQKIQASVPQANDYFGNSVALSSNWALVGAYREDTGGTDVGAAYLFPNQGRIAELETQIEELKARLGAAVKLPMPLLQTDPYGLTLSGGLLGFADTSDTPQLFDSATGKLALYFRGAHNEFFVAYYDTHTAKAQYQLVTADSKVTCVARAADTATVTISVSGDSDSTCTLVITNTATGLTETWNHLPRAAQLFADILNGIALDRQEFVGQLQGTVSGDVDELPCAEKLRRSLQAGDTLLVGDSLKVTVRQAVTRSTTTIPIQATDLGTGLTANASVHYLPYNYDNATTNQPTYRLGNGSLHLRVEPGSAKGKVQSGTATSLGEAISNQWVAESPGKTLSFDGRDDCVTADDNANLQQWEAEGDISLEAWVKPTAVETISRILHHDSGNCQYVLALQSAPAGEYRWLAAVGSVCKQSQTAIAGSDWQHLAAIYNQSYALQFQGQDYLTCTHNPTLDIDRDLTIEAFVQVTQLQDMGILAKGKLGSGIPYALYLTSSGQVRFAFDDKDRQTHEYETDPNSISGNSLYKIAVTKRQQVKTVKQTLPGFEVSDIETTPSGVTSNRDQIDDSMRADYLAGQKAANTQPSDVAAGPVALPPGGSVQYQLEVVIYVNDDAVFSKKLDKKVDASNSDAPVEIGKVTKADNQELYFQGAISEVRLWNQVRDKTEINQAIQGREEGLVSWWRLEENKGNVAYDAKSENHAAIIGANWIENPDPEASTLDLYHNGVAVETQEIDAPSWGQQQFSLAAYKSGGNWSNFFQGEMEELRIWKTARTQEQIQDNLFTRLKGEKENLIAYYTFDQESADRLSDHSLLGNHLSLGSGDLRPNFILSTAPIGPDTAIVRSALAGVQTQFHDTIHSRPAVQEYGDLQYDVDGNLTGSQKRCYAYIKDHQWHLLTGYKVGNLITEWVGQAQANPQLIGYIEGAPPVPSENLTSTSIKVGEYEDYAGTSAIELVEADSVNYIYSASKETGYDTALELKTKLGFASESDAGFGLTTSIEKTTITAGLKGNLEMSNSQTSEASVSYGRNTTKTSRLELRGGWEKKDDTGESYINKAVGRRFIPVNLGYALVQSDTMDIFALRLAHNNVLVSYRYLPNPDIPKDWNIIPFQINNRYSKQGTLDGKVGCQEDGSVQCDPDYPNAANYGQWSYFKPIEAYSIKQRIEREQQELETYYQQYSSEQGTATGTGAGAGAGTGAAIGSALGPLGTLLGAAIGAAIGGAIGGATSASDDIPKDLAARNIVNTYVWTAAGGFFSESTDLMESLQESTTGSFSLQGKAGLTTELNTAIAKVAVGLEMEALFGGHMEIIKTKGKETEKSFSLELDVKGDGDLQLYVNTDAENAKYAGRIDPESNGAYDEQGNRVKRPGKVDAYRFMTFYLEPTQENGEDFFNKVVDPIWLDQSSDPNAVSLRQANQPSKKPKCWRVFHRVTYVSRVLPEVDAQGALPVEQAMRAANVESNYELLKQLEPFVKNKTQNFVAFSDAVRETIDLYLPELRGHEPEIIKYAALYFGVQEEV